MIDQKFIALAITAKQWQKATDVFLTSSSQPTKPSWEALCDQFQTITALLGQ